MRKVLIIFLFLISTAFPVFARDSTPPVTNSKHIIAIDRKTLSILYEKDGFSQTPMASTTKIMTCIIALEKSQMSDIVTISQKASSINGSTLGLKVGQNVSVHDLLYGLMLRSGNDCAIAIAEHISGSIQEFSILMNEKAKELKLYNTNFTSPHGLDDLNHFTTAYDLALLTDYALKNNDFRKIVSTKSYTITINNTTRLITNTNELLGVVDGIYGVKTGFTFLAGRCLVSACKQNDLDIIVVVLGADTKNFRTTDSKKVLQYVFNNYEYIDVEKTIKEGFNSFLKKYSSKIFFQKTSSIPVFELEENNNYSFPFLKNDVPSLEVKINIQNQLSPSTPQNSVVGSLVLMNNNTIICQSNIILKNQLLKNSWKYYFRKCLTSII